MADKDTDKPQEQTAVKEAVKPSPVRKPPQPLPQYKVLLHNDDVNVIDYVIGTIVELTPLSEKEAKQRTIEANDSGVALLLITHKERAELYQEQFTSKQLTVTIEPTE
jgi:ATP-dependent Clp protease adaptor protein ClpS